MNELITVNGVRGYIDSQGTAHLNLEDSARGLGFTQRKGSTNYVRWDRVNSYLKEMGFPQLVGKDCIPENVFYRLAMKGETETALEFQAKVADEILPSIRKHGGYLTPTKLEEVLLNPDTLIQLATNLKDERAKREQLQLQVEKDKPKVIFAEALETSSNTILIGELAKLLKQNGIDVGQNRLFHLLREQGYLGSKGEYRNIPTQRSMDLKLFEIKTRTINNADGSIRVTKTTKVTGKGQSYFINKFKRDQAV
ncbi:phage antirepressor KilAC domain-containing protein [Paenibacillus taichungensis]|uniref:phage antirepressor KilAC domain-containing protein n=1 Tax=Paenibacillus taichungensis TaxID=484184 RepID=UPI002DB9008C|nr:phage antirepressor KilAC domain-containing protein [Paenibacillus taichungensis]MEC0110463.1 phage antirepressor KilAC domain-containing protein [Paenibacillus taichungensis]MEC0200142.1 phage antirepressor KilAC domain-containing protein [Paenibacillus taichungensis]